LGEPIPTGPLASVRLWSSLPLKIQFSLAPRLTTTFGFSKKRSSTPIFAPLRSRRLGPGGLLIVVALPSEPIPVNGMRKGTMPVRPGWFVPTLTTSPGSGEHCAVTVGSGAT
jgi:hypothetical protein